MKSVLVSQMLFPQFNIGSNLAIILLQPLTRQVLFQRFGYNLPDYGHINHDAALQTSQFTKEGNREHRNTGTDKKHSFAPV